MSLGDVLLGIKSVIIDYDVELKSHKVDYNDSFKLHYIYFDKVEGHKGNRMINWEFSPFTIPNGMTPADAFKVLSYLIDFIEKDNGLPECSIKALTLLEEALNLKRLGFTRINDLERRTISLYTVDGRLDVFKKSEFYSTYFEWYEPGVTKEEVEEIYASIGMEFHDLKKNNNQSKKLKREEREQ